MKPMGPIPPGFGANGEGLLLIGGLRADDLVAEAGGTPLFVYDTALIQRQVDLFRSTMPTNVALHYAVKANPYAPLLSWIADKVDGFDVASAGELGRVAHLGLPISFAGPGKTDQQLETAIRAGVKINLESEGEAKRVLAIGAEVNRPPKLSVRVNPPFALKGAGMKMGGLASRVRRRSRPRARSRLSADRSRCRLARPAHFCRQSVAPFRRFDRSAGGDDCFGRRNCE